MTQENTMYKSCIYLCLYVILITLAPKTNAQEWNKFRGNDSDGHGDAKNLPVEFGDELNVCWKIPIEGRAWSSPVVSGQQVWLTNAIEIEATDEQRAARLKDSKMGGMSAFARVELSAHCYDLQTGKQIHAINLFNIDDPPLINQLNSFASPTPTIEDGLIYFSFGSFGTACVQCDSGEVVWKNSEYVIDHQTGPGSSPFIHNELLFLTFDGTDQQFVVAVDKTNGQEVWKTTRSGKLHEQGDYKKSYTTPLIISVNGSEQLISPGADWVYGYDPASGEELWKVPYGKLGFSNAPQPLFLNNKVYVCTGFMRSQLLAIDVSKQQPEIAWQTDNQVPTMSSPLIVEGNIYFVSDKGIMSCLDCESGESHWQERLGGNCSSSPIIADGRIYVGNRKSEVFVIEPGDEYKLLAKNTLDSRVMATPAAVKDSLLIRTEKSLYHFQDNGKAATDAAGESDQAKLQLKPAFDHHLHVLSPRLIAEWKKLGAQFSRADEAYTDPVHIADRFGMQGAFVISMAHLFTRAGFAEPESSAEDDSPESEADRVAAENDYVAECVAKAPDRLIGFFSVNPLRDYTANEMQRCLEQENLTGMKLHLPACEVYLTNKEHVVALQKCFAWAAKNQVPILIHLFTVDPEGNSRDLAKLFWREVVAPHPELELYLAHIGAAGGFNETSNVVFEEFQELVANKPEFKDAHIYFDLSGAILPEETDGIPQTTEENCKRLAKKIEQVGAERFVFASDYPVFAADTLTEALLERVPLPKETWAKIFANKSPRFK